MSAHNRSQGRGGRSISNSELVDRLETALGIVCEEILDLKRQQQELAGRIRFIAPTPGDITREVQEFIDKSLAA